MTITPETLVQREVFYCVSALVSTLAKAAHGAISSPSGRNPYLDDAISDTMHLADQAAELAAPIDDWEEAADEARFTRTGDGKCIDRNNDLFDNAQEACEANDIEPYQREVFEHWIVSDWLADKLAEKGEKVDKDFAGMTIWARTTTGQAIWLDGVIEAICADLNGER